jgi:hypothetical protein
MPDYSKGKIYKITSGDLTYIGSTCEPTLARRLANHVSGFNFWKKGKGHKITAYQLFETDQYEITLVELCPCNSKDELTARERFHIENTVCVNKRVEGRTREEYFKMYYETNTETLKEQKRLIYKENPEKRKEQNKAYREANAESIKVQRKAYHEANAEKLQAYRKEYNAKNVEKRKAKYQAKKQLTQIV